MVFRPRSSVWSMRVLPIVLLLCACWTPAIHARAANRRLLQDSPITFPDGREKCQVCYLSKNKLDGTIENLCAVGDSVQFYKDAFYKKPATPECQTADGSNCTACTPHTQSFQDLEGDWGTEAWCSCDDNGPLPCFPASATVRRLTTSHVWEKVPLPQLRIGDTVECLVRDPVFLDNGRVTSSPETSRLSQCQVYDYKKAMTNVTAQYITVSYERPGSPTPGTVTMTANHHILDAKSGTAVKAGTLRPGDLLQLVSEDISTRVKVLKSTQISAYGAYVPLLTQGGLLIVDGIVAYPSSGDCDVGLDAKHWGQYFLAAPVWQNLNKSNPKYGKTLFELGSHPQEGPVGVFTKKFYGVAEVADKGGRSFANWGAVAAEMSREIDELSRMYSELEALAVFDKHIKKAHQ